MAKRNGAESWQKNNNKELILSELSDTQKEALVSLAANINSFKESLTSNEPDTIKYIYGRIIDEMSGSVPSITLIDSLKTQLAEHCMDFKLKLDDSLTNSFPPSLENYVHEKSGVSMARLPNELFDNILKFLQNGPDKDPAKNDFRLSAWIEKIQNLKNAIDPLLK